MNTQDNNFQNDILAYIDEVARHGIDSKEHTHRTALENLINAVQKPLLPIQPIQESPDAQNYVQTDGTPDFFIYRDPDSLFKSLVGFIECKKPALELDNIITSNQLKKYTEVCPNIIITNYREFILLTNGAIANPTTDRVLLINNNMQLADNTAMQRLVNLLFQFYQYNYEQIKNKTELAKHLARVSFYYAKSLREFLLEPLNKPHNYHKKLSKLLHDYGESMRYQFDETEFCDIFAQSLCYGLCIARIDTEKKLNEGEFDYLKFIPDEYKILMEFLRQAWEFKDSHFPTAIRANLGMAARAINLIQVESIKGELHRADHDKNSIAIYLYEDFLKEYDRLKGTENRKENGVYYTPMEATNFIVRGVNHLIKTNLQKPKGYLDKDVKLLDFACGTGTFLSSVMDEIIPNPSGLDSLSKNTIKNKILHDFYGFELLFTPYIVAHTILRQKLANLGITLNSDEDLGIFLTNTLDIDQHSISDLYPETKREHEKALDVKNNDDILAIIGNPPYFNGRSRVKSESLDQKMDIYKQGLNERNIQPLNDIYLKFIRFADWKMTKAGIGVIGIITNNSYLDGLIHRQMRKELYDHFDEIYIVNLHGNSHKKETDKNIFDIMVGVSILFLVKNPRATKKCVKYFSMVDNELFKRQEKLDFLNNHMLQEINWQELQPKSPSFLFKPVNSTIEKIYKKFTSIVNIFEYYNSGLKTENDNFSIHYSEKSLLQLREFTTKHSLQDIKQKYKVVENGHWVLERAVADLDKNYNPKLILYRPFDFRYTSLSQSSNKFIGRPRYELFKHFDNRQNLGIGFLRQFPNAQNYSANIISDLPIDLRSIGSAEGTPYFAPLYLYEPLHFSLAGMDSPEQKRPNFTRAFEKNYLGKLSFTPTPEQIMAYIYGVLHSPIYRSKYTEFLKSDFPAIPMTQNQDIFMQFAQFGQRLIDLHLLKPESLENSAITCHFDTGDKEFLITKLHQPKGEKDMLTLDYGDNKTIIFKGIQPETYNFEIGSYRPMDKWLKYRIKDKHPLDLNDLNHIKNMATAIQHTIDIMGELGKLDELYL